jgi:hypothetical protein
MRDGWQFFPEYPLVLFLSGNALICGSTPFPMRKILILVAFTFTSLILQAQKTSTDQSRPENTLNAIFDASRSGELESLKGLCPPDGSGDGDVKSVCSISGESDEEQAEFIMVFRDARIEGSITYKSQEGKEYCLIDFLFGPLEEQRKETMGLVKIGEKWYLASF